MRARTLLGRKLALATLTVVAGGSALPGAGQGTPAVDSAVRSVTPASQVARGGTRLNVTVVGRGATAFVFSRDRRRSRDDMSLGTRRLRRQRTALQLGVPRRARLGAFYLLACQPPARSGRPARCRASRRRLAVVPRPRPAGVTPRADSARTVSVALGREGGTVSATGADGTRYTLTVPAGALLDPTTVTMTPVSSVGRLPMRARLAGAVQLGPAGHELLKPATLSIARPGLPARTRLTAFGFQPDGKQFHLTPASLAAGQATLQIFKFKGHGIGAATAANRFTFSRTRLPTSAAEQLEQVAAIPRRPRGARGAGVAPRAPADDLGAMILATSSSIIATAAGGDIDTAVIHFVAWYPLAFAHPVGVALRPVVSNAFAGGFGLEIGLAQGRCLSNDIAQMGRLLRFRDYLFTSLAPLALVGIRSQIDTALERCLRFELIYDVSIQGANGYGEAVTAKVKSTVPIRMLAIGQTDHFSGQATLEVVDYSVGPVDCYTHTWNVTASQPFIVRRMRVDILRIRGGESIPPNIRVDFNLGALDEQVTHTCQGESYTDQQHAYDGVAAALLGGNPGSDFALSWTGRGSGGEYSSQTFTKSGGTDGGSYTGTFTFRLRHTPA